MNLLEGLVVQIQGLSSSAGDISRLHVILKQAEESLRFESNRLSPILNQLDPSNHSLGYLYILEACTSAPVLKEQAATLVPYIARFISFCAPEQIRLAPEKFIAVCKRFKDQVMLFGTLMHGVAPLQAAVRKLQNSSEHWGLLCMRSFFFFVYWQSVTKLVCQFWRKISLKLSSQGTFFSTVIMGCYCPNVMYKCHSC